MLTPQEIFDTVALHLLTQNAPAKTTDGACLYRAPDGKKCAAGCLIPDHLYTPKIEHMGLSNLLGNLEVRDELNESELLLKKTLNDSGIADEDFQLVYRLQDIHDEHDVDSWPEDLIALAWHHRLSDDVVRGFPRLA